MHHHGAATANSLQHKHMAVSGTWILTEKAMRMTIMHIDRMAQTYGAFGSVWLAHVWRGVFLAEDANGR